MAQTIGDDEFGAVRVKRVHGAQYVRLRISANGELIATLPARAPLRLVKQLIDDSRDELRTLVHDAAEKHRRDYHDGQRIGASHTLRIQTDDGPAKASLRGLLVDVRVPADATAAEIQHIARNGVAKALKKEAGAYLPRRLAYLAEQHGFHYAGIRYGNAKSRWGSCSSSKTISLNIALMMTPPDVIDYVLLHELCHTKEMNHSPQFWELMAAVCPDYQQKRRALKQFSPYL